MGKNTTFDKSITTREGVIALLNGNQILNNSRGEMTVYAARDYTGANFRSSQYVEVNLPEYLPNTPQNNGEETITVRGGYFINDNYPNAAGAVSKKNYIALPLSEGTECPVCFRKGSIFHLIYPTGKVEEGKLTLIEAK